MLVLDKYILKKVQCILRHVKYITIKIQRELVYGESVIHRVLIYLHHAEHINNIQTRLK